MPPANSKQPQLKQKTLFGFLNKADANSSPSSSKPTQLKPTPKNGDAVVKALSSPKDNNVDTKPIPGRKVGLSASTSSVKSSGSRVLTYSAKDTPTSDAIDVDMLSDLSADNIRVVEKPRARTSSLTEEDLEEEISSISFSQKLTTFKKTGKFGISSIKSMMSDEEEEEEDQPKRPKKGLFKANFPSPRLITYHHPPARSQSSATSAQSRRKSVSSADEDDFNASEVSYSGAIDVDEDSEAELEAKPKKSKYKAADTTEKKTKRPSMKNGHSGGSQNFLMTAAEQRTLEMKTDKKEKEDPYTFLLDVRDKDGNRADDPNYDPRTLFIPKSAWNSFTPFEKQIKQNHYDTILFFQKGKFLELYEDDARIGHRVFDLKLTQRVKMSMVGVPEMSFNFWAAKFLAKGYKVGRVDQSETALGAEMRRTADKGKANVDKIVRRELNKVYTNGTIVDGELLLDEEAGHCVSIKEDADSNTFGICVLDSATSQFDLSSFTDDVCRTKLETIMRQLRPKEILFTKGNLSVTTTRLFKNVLDGSCLWTGLRLSEGFAFEKTISELKTMFPDDPDEMEEGNGIPDAIKDMMGNRDAIEALGAMIWYLRQLNIDKDLLSMKNFNIYDPMKEGKGLVLDGQTLAHIEVLVNSEGGTEGSLLKLLGRCATPFGKRLFRLWLCMPLRDIKQIRERYVQDAVQDLIDHPTFEAEFTKIVKSLPDLERIVSRIHAKNCKVKVFLKVLECFTKLNKGIAVLTENADSLASLSIPGLLRSAPDLSSHIENIKSRFQWPENANVDELLPVEGKDKVYDDIQNKTYELEEELAEGLKTLQKKHGMKLKYWHSAQGTKEIYQVETSVNQKDIPKDWTKTGATKSVKRWSVPSLAKPIRLLKETREQRNTAIKEFKYRLYAEFDADRSVWLRAVRVIAELDCLFSLAKSSIAIGEPVCKPVFVESESAFIDFQDLRHPALNIKGDFIPNNVRLGGKVGRIALLTGPNMAYMMRMTAAGVIMAQLGMLVPAESCRLAPVDSILTRMGAYDNMFSNSSTFKVELDECCKILRDATPKSLVILDELGRGTSTFDGMAIAGAVLHHLATHTLALSCFATHYSSLTDDFADHPNIRNMHMQTMVDEEKRELLFLYKLVEGVATGSFGTHVANLAGVPLDVVTRAEAISKDFAQKFKEKQASKKNTSLPITTQADFAYLFKLASNTMAIEVNGGRIKETLRILKLAVTNPTLYH
ncbi:DNA mismatch repair protein Msh6 [Hysterangium stoloniferum]|nr:DNA mismatch repair protein Msh6 [Hysterangium stoloniferum]